MKVFLLVCALFCYTVFNVVLAKKLSALSPVIAVPVYTLVVFSIASCLAFTQIKTLQMPTTNELMWLAVCGLSILFADFCYLGALNRGASLSLATTVICLLPVSSAAFNAVIEQKLPTMREVIAMLMAVGAVWLIATKK